MFWITVLQNIFSQSVAFPFILLTVSFAWQLEQLENLFNHEFNIGVIFLTFV